MRITGTSPSRALVSNVILGSHIVTSENVFHLAGILGFFYLGLGHLWPYSFKEYIRISD